MFDISAFAQGFALGLGMFGCPGAVVCRLAAWCFPDGFAPQPGGIQSRLFQKAPVNTECTEGSSVLPSRFAVGVATTAPQIRTNELRKPRSPASNCDAVLVRIQTNEELDTLVHGSSPYGLRLAMLAGCGSAHSRSAHSTIPETSRPCLNERPRCPSLSVRDPVRSGPDGRRVDAPAPSGTVVRPLGWACH